MLEDDLAGAADDVDNNLYGTLFSYSFFSAKVRDKPDLLPTARVLAWHGR